MAKDYDLCFLNFEELRSILDLLIPCSLSCKNAFAWNLLPFSDMDILEAKTFLVRDYLKDLLKLLELSIILAMASVFLLMLSIVNKSRMFLGGSSLETAIVAEAFI